MTAGSGNRDILLSIVIPTFDAREVVLNCLSSVYENPPRDEFEVIVIDDASRDGTYEALRERFPQATVLRNLENIRYSKSTNRGLEVARGRYVYLLNNDTLMRPGTLDALVAFLEENPEVGAVGSKLLNEDGSVQWTVKALPSPMALFFGARSPLTRWFPDNRFSRRHLLHATGDTTQPFAAGYVSGASMMMRRNLIEEVGLLDERFFFLVDADHCKRIWDEGWQVYYLPTATVVHLNHRGGTMVDLRRRFQAVVDLHWGAYLYYRKHHIPYGWHPIHAVAIAGLAIRFGMSLVSQAAKELLSLSAPGRAPGPETLGPEKS